MRSARLPLAAFVLGLAVGGLVVARTVRLVSTPSVGPGVTGIGGVFFKAENPAELRAWYERHLGIPAGQQGANFFWRLPNDTDQFGLTVWSLFPRQTEYFGPGGQDSMVNYRVADLDALLERLRADGIETVRETEEYWYGRFAWVDDGEGNRVELWEPVNYSPGEFARRLEDESDR